MISPKILPDRALPSVTRSWPNSIIWPVTGIVLMLGLHLAAMFWRSINWDEFIVYSQIHQLARGELTLPLQTFQTRMLEWVLLLDLSNIDQIIAARGLMSACVLLTAGAMVLVAERFTNRKIAMVCALSWLSMGFVLQHATSLRTDGMAAALLMSSLALMLRSRLGIGTLLLTAALAALAALLTLKSVLYAPAFAGAAWLRWQEADRTRDASVRLVVLAASVPALFALFYWAHSSQLASGSDAEAVAVQSAGMMFRPFVMEYWQHLRKGAMISPFLTVISITAIVMLCRPTQRSMPEQVALIGLMLPLSAFLFYTNAFAYFFVFILPPVCVACLISIEAGVRRYSVAFFSLLLTLNGAAVWLREDLELQDQQRRIVEAADLIFPNPINYFDGTAQLGHFHKANLLLDAWNVYAYHFGGYAASMEAATEREAIPLMLVNTEELVDLFEKGKSNGKLQPRDIAMLDDTYIRFWGPYYLAGEALRSGESREAKIRVPGPYTVRDGPMKIEGVLYQPGEVVDFDRDRYQLAAGAKPARLVWGERLIKPEMPAPTSPYWVDF